MCSTLTGQSRPGTRTSGHCAGPPKKSWKAGASSVADMSTTRRPGRRRRTARSSASSTSPAAWRSCTSSTRTTSNRRSSGSERSCRSSRPSVRKSTRVRRASRDDSKRTWYATSSECSVSVSRATRRASATAATRRGCVHAMERKPARSRNCGTCVDLPQPVSPATMHTPGPRDRVDDRALEGRDRKRARAAASSAMRAACRRDRKSWKRPHARRSSRAAGGPPRAAAARAGRRAERR